MSGMRGGDMGGFMPYEKALCSMQRDPMIAITSAYRTSSTNCLKAVAGALPLDLEIRAQVSKHRLKKGLISWEEHESTRGQRMAS